LVEHLGPVLLFLLHIRHIRTLVSSRPGPEVVFPVSCIFTVVCISISISVGVVVVVVKVTIATTVAPTPWWVATAIATIVIAFSRLHE
jgi:uncharacterized Tic20 family protein